MTPHQRMTDLDEQGYAYEVAVATGSGLWRAPVVHHDDQWICLATAPDAPENWFAMAKVTRLTILILP